MLSRIAVTLNGIVFILLIPYLEISATHVFNPDWPGHARLHEVWQLLTNAVLSVVAIWLVWRGTHSALALLIALILSGTFVGAYLMMDLYDGTMKHSDGSELLVLGVNPAIAIMVVLSVVLAIALARDLRREG